MSYTPPDPDGGVVFSFTEGYAPPDPCEPLVFYFLLPDFVVVSSIGTVSISGSSNTVLSDFKVDSNGSSINVTGLDNEILSYFIANNSPGSIVLSGPSNSIDVYAEVNSATGVIGIVGNENQVINGYFVLNSDGVINVLGEEGSFGGGKLENLPTGVSCSLNYFSWKKPVYDHFSKNEAKYAEALKQDVEADFVWGDMVDVDVELSCDSASVEFIDKNIFIVPWGSFDKSDSFSLEKYINSIPKKDSSFEFDWNTLEKNHNRLYSLKADSPVPKDFFKIYEWSKFFNRDEYFRYSYMKSTPIMVDFYQYYGPYYYSLWCKKMYIAPEFDNVIFSFNETLSDGSFCKDISMYIGYEPNKRCPFIHKHSGARDQFIVIPGSSNSYPQILWSYYMLNTILVKRIPDNTEIHALSVDIQTDRDSWCWSCSLTLAERTYLDLISPSVDEDGVVYMDIEVSINNWKWIFRIENWRESISFGKTTWVASGRSPSIELSEPLDTPKNYVNNDSVQGGVLAQDILQNSGWNIKWGHADNSSTYSTLINPTTDWLIPARGFSVAEKTRMGALLDIVEALNGKILTIPNCATNKDLIIYPKYKDTPWNWGSILEDHVLVRNYCQEIGNDFINNNRINSAIVSGQNYGVIVSAVRNGTAGDLPAPLFTHPLITTQEIGSEAAKGIIASSGSWIQHTFRMFSLDDAVTPSGLFPGLILPGKFINFVEGATNWKGQVTSVQISATGNDVSQTISVEEFKG